MSFQKRKIALAVSLALSAVAQSALASDFIAFKSSGQDSRFLGQQTIPYNGADQRIAVIDKLNTFDTSNLLLNLETSLTPQEACTVTSPEQGNGAMFPIVVTSLGAGAGCSLAINTAQLDVGFSTFIDPGTYKFMRNGTEYSFPDQITILGVGTPNEFVFHSASGQPHKDIAKLALEDITTLDQSALKWTNQGYISSVKFMSNESGTVNFPGVGIRRAIYFGVLQNNANTYAMFQNTSSTNDIYLRDPVTDQVYKVPAGGYHEQAFGALTNLQVLAIDDQAPYTESGLIVSSYRTDIPQANQHLADVLIPLAASPHKPVATYKATANANPLDQAVLDFDISFKSSDGSDVPCCALQGTAYTHNYQLIDSGNGSILASGVHQAEEGASLTITPSGQTYASLSGKSLSLVLTGSAYSGDKTHFSDQNYGFKAQTVSGDQVSVTSAGGTVLDATENYVADEIRAYGNTYSIHIPSGLGQNLTLQVISTSGSTSIMNATMDVQEGTNTPVNLTIPPEISAWDNVTTHFVLKKGDGSTVFDKTVNGVLVPVSDAQVSLTNLKTSYVQGGTFSVSGVVGRQSVNTPVFSNQTGQFKVKLYTKVGSTLTPFSDYVETNPTNGTFEFTNLPVDALAGKQFVIQGEVLPPNGWILTQSFLTESTSYSFTSSAAVGGTVTAAANECSLPCTQRITLTQLPGQAAATQSIQWQYMDFSSEAVTNIPGSLATVSFVPTKAGVYGVRAVLTEKVTGTKVETAMAEITVHEAPKVTVTGPDVALPTGSAVVSATVLTPSGKAAVINSETGYLVTLDVYEGNNPNPVLTQQNVTSISFTPSMLANAVGANNVQPSYANTDYRFVFTARPAWLGDTDAKSITVAEKTVSFQVSTPSVIVKLPPPVESGRPVTLTANVTPSWGSAKTPLKVITNWYADEALIGTGTKVSYVPPIGSTPSSTPRNQAITIESFVEGAEATTKFIDSVSLQVFDYLMPEFSVKAAMDSGYAPANLRLTVSPINTTEAKKMSGKKYTYSWSIPEGFAGTAKGSTLFGRADLPGSYPISVTVTDNLQNSITLDYTLTLEQMKPYVFSLVAKPGLAFERAPMTYFLRSSITGGHPKDRIKLATLTVDGQVIGTPTSKLPGVISGLEAGSHEIKIDFESNLGQTASSTVTVNVAENQPPIVTLLAKPITRSTSYIVLPSYKDTDGKIRKVEWFIDGEPTGKSGSSMMIDMKTRSDTTVSIKITDDSGASTEASVVVPGGNGSTASAR